MNDATKDRKKFNRQIIDFYGQCQHKRIGETMVAIPEIDSVEYHTICLDCGTPINQ